MLAGRHPAAVRKLLDASLASTTQYAYQRIHRQLAIFLLRSEEQPLFPMSVTELADFIGSRFEAGCSASTLASAVSAIAHGHRVGGLPDPTTDFQIRQLLAGARRLRTGSDNRMALSLQDVSALCRALRSLPISPVDRAAFGALVPLAFFAMLRPGELVIGVNAAHTMRYSHVQVNRHGIEVTIPSSKTSATTFKVQLSARPDISICPESALRNYIAPQALGLAER